MKLKFDFLAECGTIRKQLCIVREAHNGEKSYGL